MPKYVLSLAQKLVKKETARLYYIENKEAINEYNRLWKLKRGKKQLSIDKKMYVSKHRKSVRLNSGDYRDKNAEIIKAKVIAKRLEIMSDPILHAEDKAKQNLRRYKLSYNRMLLALYIRLLLIDNYF
jgi:hypothetical protein